MPRLSFSIQYYSDRGIVQLNGPQRDQPSDSLSDIIQWQVQANRLWDEQRSHLTE